MQTVALTSLSHHTNTYMQAVALTSLSHHTNTYMQAVALTSLSHHTHTYMQAVALTSLSHPRLLAAVARAEGCGQSDSVPGLAGSEGPLHGESHCRCPLLSQALSSSLSSTARFSFKHCPLLFQALSASLSSTVRFSFKLFMSFKLCPLPFQALHVCSHPMLPGVIGQDGDNRHGLRLPLFTLLSLALVTPSLRSHYPLSSPSLLALVHPLSSLS